LLRGSESLKGLETKLLLHARAAVVLPDNVLFEGGGGETIRRELLKRADTLKRSDPDDFVGCYFGKVAEASRRSSEGYDQRRDAAATLETLSSGLSRHNRIETERFKSFTYDDLMKRDKVNLDILWLKDEALEESANLPAPETIAADIAGDQRYYRVEDS
jgi:type I restriction enzyme M protein